jgi:hypothetical protein
MLSIRFCNKLASASVLRKSLPRAASPREALLIRLIFTPIENASKMIASRDENQSKNAGMGR